MIIRCDGTYGHVVIVERMSRLICGVISSNLSIAAYNSHGHAPDRIAYVNKLLKSNDLIFMQGHWLFDSTICRLETQLTHAWYFGYG